MKNIFTYNKFKEYIKENKYVDKALDNIKDRGFHGLSNLDKLALLGSGDITDINIINQLKRLSLRDIFMENGGTFGKLMVKVRVKNINEQPINHNFSKEFAGKDGYLYPYISYSENNEAYVTVRFDIFKPDSNMKGGGTYEERPIMLNNIYPIGYGDINSDFVKYKNKIDFERTEFMKSFDDDYDMNENLIQEKSIGSEAIRLKYYSDIDKKTFYKIVNIDPTSVRKKDFSKPGKYSKWLLSQYKKGNLSNELLDNKEYTERLNYYLFIFSTNWCKSQVKKVFLNFPNEENGHNTNGNSSIINLDNDIFRYPDLSYFMKEMTRMQKSYEQETNNAKYDIVYSDDKIKILVPLNFTAAKKTALNTQWCTKTETGYNLWKNISILFRIIPKDKNYQKLKLTWQHSNNWNIATPKYPEISGNGSPFSKNDSGTEAWREETDSGEDIIFSEIEKTMSLLSKSAKKLITEYRNKYKV